MRLRETAFRDPHSFFHRYVAAVGGSGARHRAKASGPNINLKNLRENILPTRPRADLILRKGERPFRRGSGAQEVVSPQQGYGRRAGTVFFFFFFFFFPGLRCSGIRAISSRPTKISPAAAAATYRRLRSAGRDRTELSSTKATIPAKASTPSFTAERVQEKRIEADQPDMDAGMRMFRWPNRRAVDVSVPQIFLIAVELPDISPPLRQKLELFGKSLAIAGDQAVEGGSG